MKAPGFLKEWLRDISDFLTLDRRKIGVFGLDESNEAGLKRRLLHFACTGETSRFASQRGIFECREQIIDSSRSALAGSSAKYFHALIGRVLVLKDSPGWLLLQKFFPFKVFVVKWDGRFRRSSWRFHEMNSPRRRSLKAASVHPFPALQERKNSKAIILGTGPSANLVFSDAARDYDIITCNTAVKSQRLFASRNIVAHCFSDATFFVGASEYSRKFLDDLKLRMAEREFLVVHDAFHAGFLAHFLGPALTGRLQPVFLDPCIEPAASFQRQACQYSFTNILTALMLPVAATWYDEILLLGFDGKGQTRNYFWKHQEEFQYQDLLPTVREWDPGFFAQIDYDKYSSQHEIELSQLMEKVLQSGKIVRSGNPSSSRSIQSLFCEKTAGVFREGLGDL